LSGINKIIRYIKIMNKKFKLVHKTGTNYSDKRGWLKKILDGNFSSCIEIFSKKKQCKSESLP